MENKKLKILIIGSGGREHAIGWKIAQSPRCGELYFAPGNAGTRNLGINVSIKSTDIEGLIEFAKKERIDLTLAIPNSSLALGIVDEFQKEGLRIFGPQKSAARLESSKVFAKKFMELHNLPTASFKTFTDHKEAESYIRAHVFPLVIKVNGLSLGKGVFLCDKLEDALFAVELILIKNKFGNAGQEIVVEDFLSGSEISIHAITDGKNYSIFPPSQNYKRIGENDTGANTGGMGNICPLPSALSELLEKIEKTIVIPTISNMYNDGNIFSGIIYPEIILTPSGPKILEYNICFGDPETQTYMRLLDTDLLDIIDACIDGKTDQIKISWKQLFACTVVVASEGYPDSYQIEKIIDGIKMAEENENVIVFHAGTIMKDGNLVTNGGRVLGVSAIGERVEDAIKTAYEAVEKISFDKMYYRKDIGKKYL